MAADLGPAQRHAIFTDTKTILLGMQAATVNVTAVSFDS